MLVKEVMSKKPDYLSPDATLKEIAHEMQKRDCGFIPIGENDRLVGAVTDRDIAIRAVAKGKDPNKTTAREIMTEKVFYIFENDDLDKAAESMEKQHIHRLIVLNSQKRMTGILSLSDIARKCNDLRLCGEIIQGISETTH